MLEQFGEPHRRRGHLLEIVQYQQKLKVTQPRLEEDEGVAAGERKLHTAGDRLVDRDRLTLCGEVDEEDAVSESMECSAATWSAKSGLSGTSRPRDRHQSRARGVEHQLDGGQFVGAPQELRGLLGQVVGSGIESDRWGKSGGKSSWTTWYRCSGKVRS